MRFKVGEQPVPGYRLDAFLGAGSYGEVWKVIGPGGVPCAMKFISLDSKSGLKEFRSIGLVKKLQHPNLCPVNAIWLRDDEGNVLSDTDQDSMTIRLLGPKELIIAMGLGRKTLGQRLEETRGRGIPPHELLRYMVDAAKGIDYLNSPEHDLGGEPSAVIHCDIKPANLLIVGGGVQVCDYGVIRALGPDVVRKTFAAGTPAYAPPELINNEPCPQTDQYSLAITYYELRTGQLPFDETKAIVANLTGQLDLSLITNADEREVLKQALSLQPGRRFGSCEEFIDTLRIASGITLGRPPSGIHQQPMTRTVPPGSGAGPASEPFPSSGAGRESWPQSTPFADRPTPRVTPTPLPPDSAEHKPLARSTPPEPPRRPDPPRRSPPASDGTLQLEAINDVEVNFVSGPLAPPNRTPAPAPAPAKDSGTFLDDEERQSSRGAFLPLTIGLVLFLGLAATGIYIFFFKPAPDTVTAPTTQPTTPTTETKPTGSKTTETQPTGSGTRDTGSTKPTATITPPTKTTPTGSGGTTTPPTKDYSHELKKARAHFALVETDAAEIQKGLDELAKIPDPDPAKPDPVRDAAQSLKAWWKKAQDAAGLRPIELRAKFPLPTTRDLDAADLGSLTDFRRGKLTKAITDVIPRLEVESNWKELAAACAEADQTPAVLACLAECWAEGDASADKKFDAVALAAPLNGYPHYAAMRLKQAQGTKSTETVTALLKEVEAELPPWVNTRRGELLVKAFSEAAKTVPNAEAYRLLTVAERKASANDRFDIRYRRLVAGWDNGALPESLRPELKKLAQDLEKTDAERVKKLGAAEQYKFWVALASTLLDPLECNDRVTAYTESLKFAAAVPASDLRKQVFAPITSEAFTKSLPKDAEKAAALYRLAGLHVRRNRADWEAETPDAMAYAAGLFNRAVTLTNSTPDVAWKGLSLAEAKTPPLAEIAAAAKLLDAPKRTDQLVVKVFRGVAGHLQANEKATKLAAHDQFLGAFDTLAKTKSAADERPALMRWATANAAGLATAEQPNELPKPSTKPAEAPEAETYFWLATVERQRGIAVSALDWYKKAWDAATQPGAERWAAPAASDLGDTLIAEGEHQWNLGDTRAAGLHFAGLTALVKPTSPVSATRKAWYEAHTLFRSVRPRLEDLDAIITPHLMNPPAADKGAVVRMYTLRTQALTGAVEFIYPEGLTGPGNRAKRTALAVEAAEKAVELARGGPASLLVHARGALGLAYLSNAFAVWNAEDYKPSLAQFAKAKPILEELIDAHPQHELAYTWKIGLGYCVLQKIDAERDYKNVPQLGLAYALILDAKGELAGARAGSDRAAAAARVETSLTNWEMVVGELPADSGKDLLALRELLNRAAAAAKMAAAYTLTDADKELLGRIAKLAKKADTPAPMTKALDRIAERLKTPG